MTDTVREEPKYTKTFQAAIPFGHDHIYINLTIPIRFNKKIPITLFAADVPKDVALGAYTYTVGRHKETFSTVLHQASLELMELNNKISRALYLKYETPVYLNLSGSYDPFEYLALIKLILNYVDEKVKESD